MTILFHIDDKLVVTDNYDIVNTKTGEVIGKYYTNDFFENAEIWEDEHGEEKLEVHAEPLRKRSIRTIYNIEKHAEILIINASGVDRYGFYIKKAILYPVKNIRLTTIRLRGRFNRVLSNIIASIVLSGNPVPNITVTLKRGDIERTVKPRVKNNTRIIEMYYSIYRYAMKYDAELVNLQDRIAIANRYSMYTRGRKIEYLLITNKMVMPKLETIDRFISKNKDKRGHKASLIFLAILYDYIRNNSVYEFERTIVIKNGRQLSTRSLRTQLYEFLKKHQL